jgi:hypothetical protein
VNFAIPAGAAGKTFARFRFSSVRQLPFFGPAPDGEVEDYQIEILKPAVEVDQFGDVVAEIELTRPDGTLQSIPPMDQHDNVYFEGPPTATPDSDGDDATRSKPKWSPIWRELPLGPLLLS